MLPHKSIQCKSSNVSIIKFWSHSLCMSWKVKNNFNSNDNIMNSIIITVLKLALMIKMVIRATEKLNNSMCPIKIEILKWIIKMTMTDDNSLAQFKAWYGVGDV